jgi:hypothetical protein
VQISQSPGQSAFVQHAPHQLPPGVSQQVSPPQHDISESSQVSPISRQQVPMGEQTSLQHSPGARHSLLRPQQYSAPVHRVTQVPPTHSPQTETQSESAQHSSAWHVPPTQDWQNWQSELPQQVAQ